MRRSRLFAGGALLALGAMLALVVANANRGSAPGRESAHAKVESDGGGEARAGSEEGQEERDLTAERLDAFAQARANGKFTGRAAATTNAAAGWAGSALLNATTDDWEPAVATDRKAPFVYLLTTRYGQPKTCPSHCPTPFIALTTSGNGGATWSPQAPLCVCVGSGAQYDPTIEVVPKTGVVYSAFLNADRAGGFSAVFTKSIDHGQTWSRRCTSTATSPGRTSPR